METAPSLPEKQHWRRASAITGRYACGVGLKPAEQHVRPRRATAGSLAEVRASPRRKPEGSKGDDIRTPSYAMPSTTARGFPTPPGAIGAGVGGPPRRRSNASAPTEYGRTPAGTAVPPMPRPRQLYPSSKGSLAMKLKAAESHSRTVPGPGSYNPTLIPAGPQVPAFSHVSSTPLVPKSSVLPGPGTYDLVPPSTTRTWTISKTDRSRLPGAMNLGFPDPEHSIPGPGAYNPKPASVARSKTALMGSPVILPPSSKAHYDELGPGRYFTHRADKHTQKRSSCASFGTEKRFLSKLDALALCSSPAKKSNSGDTNDKPEITRDFVKENRKNASNFTPEALARMCEEKVQKVERRRQLVLENLRQAEQLQEERTKQILARMQGQEVRARQCAWLEILTVVQTSLIFQSAISRKQSVLSSLQALARRHCLLQACFEPWAGLIKRQRAQRMAFAMRRYAKVIVANYRRRRLRLAADRVVNFLTECGRMNALVRVVRVLKTRLVRVKSWWRAMTVAAQAHRELVKKQWEEMEMSIRLEAFKEDLIGRYGRGRVFATVQQLEPHVYGKNARRLIARRSLLETNAAMTADVAASALAAAKTMGIKLHNRRNEAVTAMPDTWNVVLRFVLDHFDRGSLDTANLWLSQAPSDEVTQVRTARRKASTGDRKPPSPAQRIKTRRHSLAGDVLVRAKKAISLRYPRVNEVLKTKIVDRLVRNRRREHVEELKVYDQELVQWQARFETELQLAEAKLVMANTVVTAAERQAIIRVMGMRRPKKPAFNVLIPPDTLKALVQANIDRERELVTALAVMGAQKATVLTSRGRRMSLSCVPTNNALKPFMASGGTDRTDGKATTTVTAGSSSLQSAAEVKLPQRPSLPPVPKAVRFSDLPATDNKVRPESTNPTKFMFEHFHEGIKKNLPRRRYSAVETGHKKMSEETEEARAKQDAERSRLMRSTAGELHKRVQQQRARPGGCAPRDRGRGSVGATARGVLRTRGRNVRGTRLTTTQRKNSTLQMVPHRPLLKQASSRCSDRSSSPRDGNTSHTQAGTLQAPHPSASSVSPRSASKQSTVTRPSSRSPRRGRRRERSGSGKSLSSSTNKKPGMDRGHSAKL